MPWREVHLGPFKTTVCLNAECLRFINARALCCCQLPVDCASGLRCSPLLPQPSPTAACNHGCCSVLHLDLRRGTCSTLLELWPRSGYGAHAGSCPCVCHSACKQVPHITSHGGGTISSLCRSYLLHRCPDHTVPPRWRPAAACLRTFPSTTDPTISMISMFPSSLNVVHSHVGL